VLIIESEAERRIGDALRQQRAPIGRLRVGQCRRVGAEAGADIGPKNGISPRRNAGELAERELEPSIDKPGPDQRARPAGVIEIAALNPEHRRAPELPAFQAAEAVRSLRGGERRHRVVEAAERSNFACGGEHPIEMRCAGKKRRIADA
jgi:hypothetical protein